MAGSTLQQLTESAQKSKPVLKKRAPPLHPPPPKRRFEKRQTVTFDEDARREYLTGFSKRKQQRKQHAHDAKQAKIREEIRQSRRDAALARKEQAAENVRAERRALGLLSDDEADDEEARMQEEHDFENDERRAHVTVQELDVDDWAAPAPKPAPREQLPPSSRRAARREAREEPGKPKKPSYTRPSGSLTSILEPEVANATHTFATETAAPTPAKREHHYLSAAERAEERHRQRERNHQQAEIRRAANRARAKSGAGARKKVSTTGKRRKE